MHTHKVGWCILKLLINSLIQIKYGFVESTSTHNISYDEKTRELDEKDIRDKKIIDEYK